MKRSVMLLFVWCCAFLYCLQCKQTLQFLLCWRKSNKPFTLLFKDLWGTGGMVLISIQTRVAGRRYRLAMSEGNNAANNFVNCRVQAIKQPFSSPLKIKKAKAPTAAAPVLRSSSSLDFSQIDVTGLEVPDMAPPKIPYQIRPNPYAIIWKSKRGRRRKQASKK